MNKDFRLEVAKFNNRRRTARVFTTPRTVLSWLSAAYRARRDMDQLLRMSERDLSDIGLTRQDLYDGKALIPDRKR